jgi:lysozyme
MDIPKLRKQLEIDEGVIYEIYLDHLGYPTFGIGHLITKKDEEYGSPVGTPVSKERVYEAFEQDLQLSIRECHALFGKGFFESLPADAQEILVNMMFNLGRPRLSRFVQMRAALEKRDWLKVAEEMKDSLWYRQVGNRSIRLVTRMRNINDSLHEK